MAAAGFFPAHACAGPGFHPGGLGGDAGVHHFLFGAPGRAGFARLADYCGAFDYGAGDDHGVGAGGGVQGEAGKRKNRQQHFKLKRLALNLLIRCLR